MDDTIIELNNAAIETVTGGAIDKTRAIVAIPYAGAICALPGAMIGGHKGGDAKSTLEGAGIGGGIGAGATALAVAASVLVSKGKKSFH